MGTTLAKRISLTLAVLVLLLQVVTYVLWAPEALGRRLVLHSMSGFQGGPPTFSYMVIGNSAMDQLSDRQQNGVRETLKTWGTTLVHHRDELPAKHKHYETRNGKSRFLGYQDASENHWVLHFRIPFCVHASYGNHTGPLGAYHTEGLFVWLLGRRVKVWSGPTIMA